MQQFCPFNVKADFLDLENKWLPLLIKQSHLKVHLQIFPSPQAFNHVTWFSAVDGVSGFS